MASNNQSEYTYYAFISYKREDEKWAKWLQKKLEYYKIPSVLRNEDDSLPKYIRPIFRDGTDLSGSILIDSLQDALLSSKKLIVICSTHSAKSAWVNKEVQTFIDAKRTCDIIPFIINGVPNSEDENECFPPALIPKDETKELLGISVPELGKAKAFTRLVATLLNVKFDTLWQRYRRSLYKKYIAIGIMAFIIILGGILYWDYSRSTYKYYADYYDSFGVPTGIKELSKDEVAHRSNSYMMEYKRVPFGEPNALSWRVVKVSAVNSLKQPQEIQNTEFSQRYPIQIISYYPNSGNISQITYCNADGKPIEKHNYISQNGKPASVVDIVKADEEKGSGFISSDQLSLLNARMDNAKNKAQIVRFKYERDSDGFIIKQTFHANNDIDINKSLVADENGIFGVTYKRDSVGRPIEINFLDRNGYLTSSNEGIFSINYEYDKLSNVVYTSYCDSTGTPIPNELGWAICRNVSDTYGNIVEEHYYDAKDKPCYSNRGVSIIRYKYNPNGFLTDEYFYNDQDKRCLNYRDISRYSYQLDKQGNVVKASFYDVSDQLSNTIFGFAQSKNKYDKNGNCIEVAYYDKNGKSCFSIEGCAKWTRKYDKNGNCIEHWFYGTDNNLCTLDGKTAGWIAEYNEDGLITKKSNYDSKRALSSSEDGFAICKYFYDDYGNLICNEYYDFRGNPCVGSNGFASWKAKYNPSGLKVHESYFDVEGKPCLNDQGFSSISIQYNDKGEVIYIIKYDVNGNAIL